MLRRILSLVLMIVSLAGATLDSGIALNGAEAKSASFLISAYASSDVSDQAGVFEGDSLAQTSISASDACHDCHIGHCNFLFPPKSIVGSSIHLNSHDLARSDILPSDLISYIPRPPAAAALV